MELSIRRIDLLRKQLHAVPKTMLQNNQTYLYIAMNFEPFYQIYANHEYMSSQEVNCISKRS